ncbi:hypothetical protein AB0C07_22940 [Actinoplanes missouriensis]|uniref:hypothetical protein n=1 Tax=Actinoplanes missouriensis TaxID=1866 RepID=UPI0033F56ADE
MTTPHEARMAELDHRVAAAEQSAAARHAGLADAIRHPFQRLRSGLGQAHARCAAVDEKTWATYVADLDRGLGELQTEVDRAAERVGEPGVAQVLDRHVTALELAGWRLQVNLPADHAPVR